MYRWSATLLIAVSSIAVADERDPRDPGLPGDDLVVDPNEAIAVLMGMEIAKDYADTRGGFPNADTLDPDPGCEGWPSASFNVPLYEQEEAGFDFSLEATGSAGMVWADDRFGFQASIAPTIKFFGNEKKPLELRTSATANNAGVNAIALDILAFDQVVVSETLAETNQAVEYVNVIGWQMPMELRQSLSGSWSDTFDCDDGDPDDCNGSVSTSYSAVADLAAIIVLRVDANGVESRSLAAVNAYAGLRAQATWDDWWDLDVDINLGFSAQIDLIHALFGGRGLLVRSGDQILVDAKGILTISDSMAALMRFFWDIPDWADWVPGIPDTISFTLFKLEPYSDEKTWTYRCRFKQRF